MKDFPPFPDQLKIVEKNELGEFYIYPKFVIGMIHEGVNLKLQQLSVLVALYEKHYHLQDFVYISYRIHSYSIDPTTYTYLLEMDNLKGLAVVTDKTIAKQNFQVEKVFYSENMRIFDTLNQAISWANDIID